MSLEKGMVPVAPIKEAIERSFCFQDWTDQPAIQPLSLMWSLDDFQKMFVNREWVSFDFADQILCLLGLQYLWWGELEDIYYAVNLDTQRRVRMVPKGHKRCIRPGCDKTFEIKGKIPRSGVTSKKYCSRSCRTMHHRYLSGERPWPSKSNNRERLTGEGGFVCRNGHERTPENTLYDRRGRRCRICANETARRNYWNRKALLAA